MDFQEYGYFDSEITGYDEEGFPILDRAQNSEIFALFYSKLISNGVLATPADCLMVQADEGMTIKVNPGFLIINGHFGLNIKPAEITLDNAPSQYRRVTAIMGRLNLVDRKMEIIFRNGDTAVKPSPPEPIQPSSGDYYELCLATIMVNSNQTVITQSDITDTRYDSSVCGVVTQLIDHLETDVFFAQLNQFYSEFVERSDDSYNAFVQSMTSYLAGLSESGDQQLKAIVAILNAFEVKSENDFNAWFQNIKDILSDDVAGKLQLEIEELQQKCKDLESENKNLYAQLRETTEMLIMGNIITTILDADGLLLEDSDGAALVNVGKIHII